MAADDRMGVHRDHTLVVNPNEDTAATVREPNGQAVVGKLAACTHIGLPLNMSETDPTVLTAAASSAIA